VSDEMIAWKKQGTALYQQLPAECFETLKVCEPLQEVLPDRLDHSASYLPYGK
jgi:hypothetical protein